MAKTVVAYLQYFFLFVLIVCDLLFQRYKMQSQNNFHDIMKWREFRKTIRSFLEATTKK